MHPLPAFLGFLAALVAFVALWDNLIYVDIRDRKRKLRWRRHASAEDQAIRCEYCLQPIESRRDVFTAKDRYLGRFRLLYVLHGRCARTLERTGRWKIRPAGQWGRMLIDVTAMWAGTFALAAVLAPRTDLREMWIVLPLFYAIVLSLRCDYYLRVERDTRGWLSPGRGG